MIGRRKKPVLDGKIEKPEDKAWKEEFDRLGVKEHEDRLRQLGLDEEDIEEWEQAAGFKPQRPGQENKKKPEK